MEFCSEICLISNLFGQLFWSFFLFGEYNKLSGVKMEFREMLIELFRWLRGGWIRFDVGIRWITRGLIGFFVLGSFPLSICFRAFRSTWFLLNVSKTSLGLRTCETSVQFPTFLYYEVKTLSRAPCLSIHALFNTPEISRNLWTAPLCATSILHISAFV